MRRRAMPAATRDSTIATASRVRPRRTARKRPTRLRTKAIAVAPGTMPKMRFSATDHVAGPPAGPIRAPQDAQNRAPAGRSFPQELQLRAIADTDRVLPPIERA